MAGTTGARAGATGTPDAGDRRRARLPPGAGAEARAAGADQPDREGRRRRSRAALPGGAQGRSGRRLPRDPGRGSVPVARGHRLEGDAGLDRGRERADGVVSGHDSGARTGSASGSRDPVELRAASGAPPSGRGRLLRRTTTGCRTSRCFWCRHARREAQRAARPQHPVGGRHRGPLGHGVQRRRDPDGLRRLGRGIATGRRGRSATCGPARTWRTRSIGSSSPGPSWTADGQGFFYGRYDEPPTGQELAEVNMFQKLYYHRVGHAPGERRPGVRAARPRALGLRRRRSPRTAATCASPVWMGTADKTGSSTAIDGARREDGRASPRLRRRAARSSATRGRCSGSSPTSMRRAERLVAIERAQARGASTGGRVIPQSRADPAAGSAWWAKDVRASYLAGRPLEGRGPRARRPLLREVDAARARHRERVLRPRGPTPRRFYAFASFATPPTIYRYDVVRRRPSGLPGRPKVDFDPDAFETKQVFYHSATAPVPMFITTRRASSWPANNPTLSVRLRRIQHPAHPPFLGAGVAWMEMGGRLRRGQHARRRRVRRGVAPGGTKQHKQNVFDDFIAAAQYLIDEELHEPGEAGHRRAQQRRALGRRGDDAAAGPVRRGPARGRA